MTRRSLVTAALLAGTMALAACGGESANTADESEDQARKERTRFEAAYAQCGDAGKTLTSADENTTLIIDTGSERGSLVAMTCVLNHLQTSQAIRAQMDATTAMMGVQDAEEDGITYKWSYHPDNGVNMVIKDTQPRKK
jgi:hypothetical protein